MKTVLVVEDNEKNMKLFRDVLEHAGYGVLCAGTGEKGLDFALTRRPDLVLMDIQLPDRDGISVLRDIRAQVGASMPVLAVSASVMPDDQQRIVASGFDGFITKPVNLKNFLASVKQAVGDA